MNEGSKTMLLKILTNIGIMDFNLDIKGLQDILITDARTLQ